MSIDPLICKKNKPYMLLGWLSALDGYTSTSQEELFKEHVSSEYNQTFYITLGSCSISSLALVVSG